MKASVYLLAFFVFAFNLLTAQNPGSPETGTCTDARDGKVYKTVRIGTQWWLSENMAYLPAINYVLYESYTEPYYYVYDYFGFDVGEAKTTTNYINFGALYNWPAAMTACPEGWHLPSDQEWKVLEITLGMPESHLDVYGGRGTDQGYQMKSTSGWNMNNNGSNSSGFSGLPGGYRHIGGGFIGIGDDGKWHASTEASANSAWRRDVNSSSSLVGRYSNGKNYGFSVRCIKNISLPEADAGSDQSIDEGAVVTLDGSASFSPGNLPLTYLWTAPAGIILSDASSVSPTFTAPRIKKDTTFAFILVVNDGTNNSSPDTVMITVKDKFISQGIDLKVGWNIISFNVLPDSLDMKAIFFPLISDGSLIKVQDETGNALEDMGIFGGWQNNIGNMSLTEGYKVKVNRNCNLNIDGLAPVLPFKIPLKSGWNIMGYPLNKPLNGKVVVRELINRGILVKVQDENGNAIEDYGVFGGWQNYIGNFLPGEGYKIKVNTGDTLIISDNPNANWQSGDTWFDVRDEHQYKTVQIGNQVWMAENLAYLPVVNLPSDMSVASVRYYVNNYFSNDVPGAKAKTNYLTYGVLYNWASAKISCPEGWHLPSDEEWKTMEMTLGMTREQADTHSSIRGIDQGTQAKATFGWDNNGNGSNSSGFTALPGGEAVYTGFGLPGHMGTWWTSTEKYISVWIRMMISDTSYIGRLDSNADFGYSVRCLKN